MHFVLNLNRNFILKREQGYEEIVCVLYFPCERERSMIHEVTNDCISFVFLFISVKKYFSEEENTINRLLDIFSIFVIN